EPRRSCLVPLVMVDGASVTTIEGLGAPDELSPMQAAFDEHYAAQCGFCTAGFVLAATALVERNPGATRDDVLEALSGHVCRCTGPAHLDTSRAEAPAGVPAVVTRADVPRNVYGHLEALGIPADEPLLAEEDVRYKGQPIALVAAEDEDTAREAVELIGIEFE